MQVGTAIQRVWTAGLWPALLWTGSKLHWLLSKLSNGADFVLGHLWRLITAPIRKLYRWMNPPFQGVEMGVFRLAIKPGRFIGPRHVVLRHLQNYVVCVQNRSGIRCECVLMIDGEHRGTFRLAPYGRYEFERPATQPMLFTFVKDENAKPIADSFGVAEVGSLVEVTFQPETYYAARRRRDVRGAGGAGGRGAAAGAAAAAEEDAAAAAAGPADLTGFVGGRTMLFGNSNQPVWQTGKLRVDELSAVRLSMRLIAEV